MLRKYIVGFWSPAEATKQTFNRNKGVNIEKNDRKNDINNNS